MPGPGVIFSPLPGFEHRLHHSGVPGVPIMIGVLEEVAALAKERVIDAPGIDGDAGKPRVRGTLETPFQLQPQTENVPLQRAIPSDRFVLETVDLLKAQDPRPKPTDDGAAAFGAEVEGEEISAHGR